MKFFKSKEEREEEKVEEVSRVMEEEYGLTDLDSIDVSRIESIKLNKRGNTAIKLGSKPDITLISSQLEILEEQNWMIIKLLKEIKDNQKTN